MPGTHVGLHRKLCYHPHSISYGLSMKKHAISELEHEISRTRQEIIRNKEKLSRLARRLPKEEIKKDYSLKDWNGHDVKLSKLFGESNDLILVHNMGRQCPYCTLWADGFNGLVNHLEDRASFVVVSPDSPKIQKEFAKNRGWKFRMLSGHGNSFIKDMGFEKPKRGFMPGVSVFRKEKDGRIFRVAVDQFGPGDDYCMIWHFFDLLPLGPNGWEPKFSYPKNNKGRY